MALMWNCTTEVQTYSWKYCTILSARHKAKMAPLFKEGKKNNCENYRGFAYQTLVIK